MLLDQTINKDQQTDFWVEIVLEAADKIGFVYEKLDDAIKDIGAPELTARITSVNDKMGNKKRQVMIITNKLIRDHHIYVSAFYVGNVLTVSRGLLIETGFWRRRLALALEKADNKKLGWDLSYFKMERLKSTLRIVDSILNTILSAVSEEAGEGIDLNLDTSPTLV